MDNGNGIKITLFQNNASFMRLFAEFSLIILFFSLAAGILKDTISTLLFVWALVGFAKFVIAIIDRYRKKGL